MIFRRLIIAFALLFAVAATPLRADHVIAKKADGTTVDYPGVMVKAFVRADGAANFWIAFTVGNIQPIPAERAILVEWGDGGVGRQVSITVGDVAKSDAAPYVAMLKSYKDGKFKASPAGDTKDYYIAISNMQGFAEPGFTPPASPAPGTPAPATADGAFNSAPANTPAPAAPAPAASVKLPAPGASTGISPKMLLGLNIGVIIVAFLFMAISITTTIILAADAFSHERTMWGIFIIICCGGGVVKLLYAVSHYHGKWRTPVLIAVVVETALAIGDMIMGR